MADEISSRSPAAWRAYDGLHRFVHEGTPARPRACSEKLFSAARDRKFAFVISFVHRDYDALWEKIRGTAPEFFVAWRDGGLVDGKGEPRPALELWRRTFALPLSP